MGARGPQVIREQSLFQEVGIHSVYPFVTSLTLGLVKVYRMPIDPKFIYLVDVGYNDVFVYESRSASDRYKRFWKLNLEGAPPLKAICALRSSDISVTLPNIPSFDAAFEGHGAWVALDYTILVRVEISPGSAGQVHEATNPLTTIKNAALKAARQVLPFIRYEEALIAFAQEDIQRRLIDDPIMRDTSLRVASIAVEGVEGSERLAEAMQESFQRVLQAKDRREIALQFASLDKDIFQKMLEAEEPKAALEMRARQADQMMQALLASGLNPLQVHQVIGGIARDIPQPENLARQVAEKAFKQIKPADWPPLQIPRGISHEQRLRWEHQVMRDRLGYQVQDTDDTSDTFSILLETSYRLVVIWSAPELPPQVYIDGRDRRGDYVMLGPGIYDYSRTTVWDLYIETRRLLGV
jgi:hypothetical protein